MRDKILEDENGEGDPKSPLCSTTDQDLSGYDADIETTPESAQVRCRSPLAAVAIETSPEEQAPPPGRRRRCRTLFTDAGLRKLEAAFVADPYPDILQRDCLADRLGVTEDRIQVWFQNRRSKRKRDLLCNTSPPSLITSCSDTDNKPHRLSRPTARVAAHLSNPSPVYPWIPTRDPGAADTTALPHCFWTVPTFGLGSLPSQQYRVAGPAHHFPHPFGMYPFTATRGMYISGEPPFYNLPSQLTGRPQPFYDHQQIHGQVPLASSFGSFQSGLEARNMAGLGYRSVRLDSSDAHVSSSEVSSTVSPVGRHGNVDNKENADKDSPTPTDGHASFKPKRPWEDSSTDDNTFNSDMQKKDSILSTSNFWKSHRKLGVAEPVDLSGTTSRPVDDS